MDNSNLFIDGNNLPKTLSKDEIYELIYKAQHGDKFSRNKVIKYNIRLVLFRVIADLKMLIMIKKI